LRRQGVYTSHRQRRARFQRNHYIVSNRSDLLEADLIDVRSLSSLNDGYNYILTLIDCFSRYLWTAKLYTKTGREITDAFQSIFTGMGNKILSLRTDRGLEFTNTTFQTYLAKEDITCIRTNDPSIKASVVERLNRTLKSKIWKYFTHNNTNRYIDVLDDMTHAYNNTFHRSIKMCPAQVSDNNIKTVYRNINDQYRSERSTKPKLKVNDHVTILIEKGVFEKSYLVNWSDEEFLIHSVIPRRPRPLYRIRDLEGEVIQGLFYEHELQLIEHDPNKSYKISQIHDRRTRRGVREVLVNWRGHHKKHNSWIKATEVTQLLK
jgi:hypothetical protein